MSFLESLKFWGKSSMFQNMELKFAGPICGCEKENLNMTVVAAGDKSTLDFACKTCGVKVVIPWKQVKVRYVFERPYPTPDENKEPASLIDRLKKS